MPKTKIAWVDSILVKVRHCRIITPGILTLNKLEIGVALIRKIDQRARWLGKFNRSKEQIDFVVAERLENESWRESVMREVAWTLDIDRKRDFVVSNMAQLNIQVSALLPGCSEGTNIACAFYNFEFYRKAAVEKVDQNKDLVWLTSNEICNGVSEDGIELDPLILILNEEANVIQHWESDLTGE